MPPSRVVPHLPAWPREPRGQSKPHHPQNQRDKHHAEHVDAEQAPMPATQEPHHIISSLRESPGSVRREAQEASRHQLGLEPERHARRLGCGASGPGQRRSGRRRFRIRAAP